MYESFAGTDARINWTNKRAKKKKKGKKKKRAHKEMLCLSVASFELVCFLIRTEKRISVEETTNKRATSTKERKERILIEDKTESFREK